MKPQLFKTFITFVESPTMEEAAQKLSLTQAGVSQQLKMLEEEFGKPLFQYQGKKKSLNQTGQGFYNTLKPTMKKLEIQWEELRSQQLAPADLTLRIAGRKEMLETITSKIQFSGKVIFESSPSKEAFEKLIARETDVALLNFKPKHNRIVLKKLVSIRCRWFNPLKAPLDTLKTEKLYQIPIIAYSSKMPFLEEWCAHYGLRLDKLNIKAVIDNWYMVKCLSVKYQALAIVPDNIDAYAEFDGEFLPPSVIDPIDFYYAYHEDSRPLLKQGSFTVGA